MQPQILLVEGQRAKALSWAPLLERKGYSIHLAHTRRNANAWLELNSPDLLIVDARFLRFDAVRFYCALRSNGNQVPILLILPEGAEDQDTGATAVLQGKPTPRKLYNRVRRLLPGRGDKILRFGPLVLDLERHIVTREGRQYRLTPKQARLLEVFMRNPGRVLPRPFLMKKVWDTDFVDDTRTLEVHIHWLRRAIEENPADPAYLITVRRVGYRFDVPSSDCIGQVS